MARERPGTAEHRRTRDDRVGLGHSGDQRTLVSDQAPRRLTATTDAPETLIDHERQAIESALKASHGRVAGPFGAARRLGLPPTPWSRRSRPSQSTNGASRPDSRPFVAFSRLVVEISRAEFSTPSINGLAAACALPP